MLRKISGKQFREWLAFSELEPFGPRREDERFASIVQALYNIHRKRGSSLVPLENCILLFGDAEKPKKSWQSMKDLAKQLTEESKLEAAQRAARRRHR